MDLLHHSAALGWLVPGWLVLAAALAIAARSLRGPLFRSGLEEHAWFAGIALVALLWLVPIKIGQGPAFGMLGVGLFCVVFGALRGMLGLTLAVVVHTAFTDGAWANVGLNAALLAVVPALLAGACQKTIARLLPRHLFVFLIGNGLVTTLLATAVAGALVLLAASANGAAASWNDGAPYLGAMLLLAYGEAITSGMLFAALVVFAPQVVPTYDADVYLPRPEWRR